MRLIDGEFPNYEQVIPKSTRFQIAVEKSELLSALKRVSVVASDRARGVKLSISPDQLLVSASSPDHGDASEEIATTYSGDEMTVGFNARYPTDVLTVLPDGVTVENRAERRREPRRGAQARRRELQLRRDADAALRTLRAIRQILVSSARVGGKSAGPDPSRTPVWKGLSDFKSDLGNATIHVSQRICNRLI
jgi:hypothetical protein